MQSSRGTSTDLGVGCWAPGPVLLRSSRRRLLVSAVLGTTGEQAATGHCPLPTTRGQDWDRAVWVGAEPEHWPQQLRGAFPNMMD